MTRELSVEGIKANENGSFIVIAELGHNHQGDINKAKLMIDAAKECGVNAIKLQKRHNKKLYTKALYEQPYINDNSFGTTYGQHREKLELNYEQYKELQAYCRSINLVFFATPFDFESVDFLAKLDVPLYKIASGDLLNIPLQKYIASTGKPILLSTGGGSIDDIRRACDAILPINTNLCILHCTASYPAETEDLNLLVIPKLREEFPEQVIGLSDHENGIDAASIAYMLGARVFEKHFTINRAWKGTDQSFSLEPQGMRRLVRNLKRIPVALGDGNKRMMESEIKPLNKMGKMLVASTDLKKGHVLKAEDIAIKSPGNGIPPFEMDKLVGMRLNSSIQKDTAFDHKLFIHLYSHLEVV